MIPFGADPAILREHLYQDRGNIRDVLNPDTFYDRGNYKSIFDYGIGYFNYYRAIDDNVYKKDWIAILRGHICDHLSVYLTIFAVAFLFWVYCVVIIVSNGSRKPNLRSRKRRPSSLTGTTFEYQHVKV